MAVSLQAGRQRGGQRHSADKLKENYWNIKLGCYPVMCIL